MKCKECKYYDKKGQAFENTTMHKCKCAYYLLKQLKKIYKSDGKSHAYLTTALTNAKDTCMFEYTLLTFDD